MERSNSGPSESGVSRVLCRRWTDPLHRDYSSGLNSQFVAERFDRNDGVIE
jgi:hypothetical protein